MEVIVKSVLGNKPKEVSNVFYVENVGSVEALYKMIVTDKTAILMREDGQEVQIVANGIIYTEAFNQKQLLVDWCNHVVDEFPIGGQFAKSAI